MGLKKGASAIYLTVVNGRLAKRVKVKNSESVTRVTTEGNTIEEEIYKAIEGYIVGIDTKTHPEYGDTLLVYIKEDHLYCIQMNLDSRYAANFLKTLPNVDLEKPVEFTPSLKSLADGKSDITVFLSQNDKPVKRFYTKDNSHGLPEPVFIKGKRGAKDKWDFTAVTEWLYDNIVVVFRDALKEKAKNQGVPAAEDLGIEDIIPNNSDL